MPPSPAHAASQILLSPLILAEARASRRRTMEREEILERLVALHDERVEEEKRGQVRWLRPEFQIPRYAPDRVAAELDLPEEEAKIAPIYKEKIAWPKTAVEQIAAVQAQVGRGARTVEALVASFDGAPVCIPCSGYTGAAAGATGVAGG